MSKKALNYERPKQNFHCEDIATSKHSIARKLGKKEDATLPCFSKKKS